MGFKARPVRLPPLPREVKRWNLKHGQNTMWLLDDPSCEMAELVVNGKVVYVGNYWDFHPGCFGEEGIGDFNGRHSLMHEVEMLARAWDMKVENRGVVRYKYEE